jgi:hypothetical protein
MDYDHITGIVLRGAEKRKHKGDKYYAYCLAIMRDDGRVEQVWRRYSEFDALRETLVALSMRAPRAPYFLKINFIRDHLQSARMTPCPA